MAGTIIDSLVVSLELDPRDFTKGEQAAVASLRQLEAEAGRTGDSVSRSTGGMSDSFSGLGESIGGVGSTILDFGKKFAGVLALVAGGKAVIDTFTNSISRMAEVGRDARIIGMSTQDLSGWQNAIRSVGGDPAAITGTLRSSSMALEGARDFGQASGFTNVLQSLGISASNEDGSNRSVTGIYEDLADKLRGMNPQQAAYWANMAGLDPDTTNLLLSQSSAQLADTLKKEASVTPGEAKDAQGLQQQWAQIVADQQKIANSLSDVAIPAIERAANVLVNALNKFMGDDPTLNTAAGKATDWLEAAHNALSGGGPGLPKTPQGQAALQQGLAYFQSKGWSFAHASGIMSNALTEDNSLNPNAVSPDGGAHGIFQWRGDRWKALVAKYGPKPTYQQQLEFFNAELQPGGSQAKAGAALRTATTPDAAAAILDGMDERSGDSQAQTARRGALALQVASAYGSKPTAPAGAATMGDDNGVSAIAALKSLNAAAGISPPAAASAAALAAAKIKPPVAPAPKTVNIGPVTINAKQADAKQAMQHAGKQLSAAMMASLGATGLA